MDALAEWWLGDVRHQSGDDWDDPDAPMLPSWSVWMTPHTLRHFCASSLCERGLDLKAIQEVLGPPDRREGVSGCAGTCG